jgi:hypothetical protein
MLPLVRRRWLPRLPMLLCVVATLVMLSAGCSAARAAEDETADAGQPCPSDGVVYPVEPPGICETPKTCGSFLTARPCAADEYCAYFPGENCGGFDGLGRCLKLPQVCNADPVCGCDQHTYRSACEAARAGVGYRARGACP